MPTVSITVNQRSYQVACDPGEEERVRGLAAQVDAQIGRLGGGGASEAQLLLMAGLMLADEAEALRQRLENQVAADQGAPAADSGGDPALNARLEGLAQRVAAIADRLDPA